MINLIPDELKQTIRFSIKNSSLIRYNFIAAGTAVAIICITTISILSMQQTKNNLQKELDQQNLKLASYKKVEADGQKLYDNVSSIQQLLDRQIRFSSLLPELAAILPPGAVLKQLDFSTLELTGPPPTPATNKTPQAQNKVPEKPFVIQAAVTDRAVAATLLENIRAKTDLFTGADLIDVTLNESSSSQNGQSDSIASRYPYQVTINAYFKKTGTATTRVQGLQTTNANPFDVKRREVVR